jgi:hypothetical protein
MILGRRDDADGVQFRILAHFLIIGVAVGDTQLIGNLGNPGGIDVADGRQFSFRNFGGQIGCMFIAQTAKANGSDFYFFHG